MVKSRARSDRRRVTEKSDSGEAMAERGTYTAEVGHDEAAISQVCSTYVPAPVLTEVIGWGY